jgi:hypothetical protein
MARQITGPLLTCEAVLAEAAFHASSSYVLNLIADGTLRIAFESVPNLQALSAIASRYQDICVIRISELHPRYPVIAVDESDFRLYRRNKRELIIPIICPPSAVI